ncbi:MAG: bifunctional oligoribonuclease/PAP phosphatase NrnA [Synergistaceae bacterium]|jgi:phosphoesterase RecJ-like protein|nr:bifunctional oligoribonuclease/PAP phosphatase NrnA [Synergistaceae bacterium]
MKTLNPEVLSQVARTLSEAASWYIFSHMKLDGDALGSGSALFEAGLLQGKNVRWTGPDPVPPSYDYLPNVENYRIQESYVFDSREILHIFLDSADEDRGVKGLRDARLPHAFILNIDHHEDNSLFGTMNCVEPGVSSVAELLWHIMQAGGWNITPRVAEGLYTGIISDTGGFMYSNTSPETHRVAADLLCREVDPAKIDAALRQNRSLEGMHLWGLALSRICRFGVQSQIAMTWLSRKDFETTGAIVADTESLVNQLLLIQGVRFAAMVTEGEKDARVSFRSRAGAVTAASVARSLGGGGHPRAAGTTLPLPLEDAIQIVRTTVENAYAEWFAAD